MGKATPVHPLFVIKPGSWLSRQIRQQVVTAPQLKRRGHHLLRLERLGVITPLKDLGGVKSAGLPAPDAIYVIEHPEMALEALEAFVEGEERIPVLEAMARRLRKAAELEHEGLEPEGEGEGTGEATGEGSGEGEGEVEGESGTDGGGQNPEASGDEVEPAQGKAPEDDGKPGARTAAPHKKKAQRKSAKERGNE